MNEEEEEKEEKSKPVISRIKCDDYGDKDEYNYKIQTENKKQDVICYMDMNSRCCERFGTYLYLNEEYYDSSNEASSKQKLEYFEDAIIESIKVLSSAVGYTDTDAYGYRYMSWDQKQVYEQMNAFVEAFASKDEELCKKHFEDEQDDSYYVSNKVVILIETSKGEIKIIMYNEHNGYYPHNFSIQIGELHYSGML